MVQHIVIVNCQRGMWCVMRISKPFLVVSVQGLDAGEFARQHLHCSLVWGQVDLQQELPQSRTTSYMVTLYLSGFTAPGKISQAFPLHICILQVIKDCMEVGMAK